MDIFNEKLDKAKNICILGHQMPDGDCIGSALAIYNYVFNKYGKDKTVKIYLTEFSKKYLIMPNANKISHDTNDAEIYDLCIVVDCSDTDRFKDFKRYFEEAKDSIVFDHHENNNIPAKTTICDPNSIATCEILSRYLNKDFVNKDVAICLYVGLATDSGVFRYKAVNKDTFELASKLIQYDFDHTKLLDSIVFDNSLNQRKAQALVFDRIKLYRDGTISYSYMTQDELDRFNLTKNDIDNMIVYLREIDGVEVAAFAYQVGHDIFKISLRSKEMKYDVSEFARLHEGGGHKLASGCIYHGDIKVVSDHLLKDLEEFMNEK